MAVFDRDASGDVSPRPADTGLPDVAGQNHGGRT